VVPGRRLAARAQGQLVEDVGHVALDLGEDDAGDVLRALLMVMVMALLGRVLLSTC
jgi:hypothetical protein